ncbi:MAG: TrbC/VirB2 family protein [Treponema sp.]|jgi:type IV secretory pathway VirB2 component (pilin)|nr:TrbC/VirB2 family protein [Treponema sp.]
MKILLLALFYLFGAASAFAADVLPAGMSTLMDNILEVFKGTFVRTILIIFLCGTAIAYGFNKDNEKMKRNCIAIGISIAILIGASAIVEAIWNASS